MDDKVNSRSGFQPMERQTKETTNPLYDHQVQVGTASLLLGSGIALFGLTRRSVRGMALALVGAGVAVTGAKTRFAQSAHETVVHSVLTINKPRHEVYERWRHLEDLPRAMKNLQAVQEVDEQHSHWSATGPLGQMVEWDAETTSQEQDTAISWRSLPTASIPNHGWVRFSDAPSGRGTQVDLTLSCRLPGGVLGAVTAGLSGRHPRALVENDLRRFKAILEAGEAPTTRNQPAGDRSAIGRFANAWAGAR